MKKILLLLILFSSFTISKAQLWANSLEDAKKLAKATNKLIIVDFTATWCGPCQKMKMDYWNNEAYKKTLDKFIIVPIDIDGDKSTASNYGVQSIPNIFLVDTKENRIYNKLGYEGATFIDGDLTGYPDGVKFLYDSLEFKDQKKPTDEELLTLGSAYQALLQLSKSATAQSSFKRLSNESLSKCKKISKNADYIEKADIAIVYNDVLLNNTKKAYKALDFTKISSDNQPFAHYVLAQAFYVDKNKEDAEKEIAAITQSGNEEWISNAHLLSKRYSK